MVLMRPVQGKVVPSWSWRGRRLLLLHGYAELWRRKRFQSLGIGMDDAATDTREPAGPSDFSI